MEKFEKGAKRFNGHEFKKSLGQNFISDTNLLKSISADAGVTKADFVLEIGAGAGTLSKILAENAHGVLSFEIDESLKPDLLALSQTTPNLTFCFADFLKVPEAEIKEKFDASGCTSLKVVANIPYYITTPLLFKILGFNLPVSSVTVMVQKEVAERMVAEVGSPDYGALSCALAFAGKAKICRVVKRQNFYPMPKVDSAVVTLSITYPFGREIEEAYGKVVKSAFARRRKTLANNFKADLNLPAEQTANLLAMLGKKPTARGEELSAADFALLAKHVAMQ